MFVGADVSVGVGAFVCVCKLQLQDPSWSIASVKRPVVVQPHALDSAALALEVTDSQLVNMLGGLKYVHRLRGCGFRR